MKIKLGFVTNSSSTNHTIMWIGKKNDLRKLLLKYIDRFPSSFEDGNGRKINVNRSLIIDAICNSLDQSQFYFKKEEYKEDLIREKESYESYIQRKDISLRTKLYLKKTINNLNLLLKKIDKMNNIFEVEFGDSHGITGDIGRAMDIGNTELIIEDDLIIASTNNH